MTGTTDEIKARLNIVELIGSYVRLEKAGAHWKARCPFHQERTPSFMVNEEKQMWHCFGCSKGGDIFAFVMEIETLEFREALVLLAGRAGVELPKYRSEKRGTKDKERLYEVLELATKFYEHQLSAPVGEKIRAYLSDRGLSESSVKRFRLGYAPEGWRHLSDFLLKKGYTVEEMEKAGLVIRKTNEKIPQTKHQTPHTNSYDRFRDRIMFPVFDIIGRVIGYSARVAPGGDETQAKYINTPESPVYHKSRALYGLFHAKQAMKKAGVTVIVEGNMDVIALHQAGIENAVAVSGTALTPEQLSIIKRYGEEVRLFFDMDGAGQKAARTSTALALSANLAVSLVALSAGKDAADMGKDHPAELQKAVERPTPALEYFLDQFLAQFDRTSALGKRKIAEAYTELLVLVQSPVERAHYIRLAARALDMDERTVAEVVNSALSKHERREGPARYGGVAAPPARPPAVFGSRAERLREELVALLYVDQRVRERLWSMLLEPEHNETRAFVERHPLAFFIVQAGAQRDPLELIEDPSLKSEATRLVFRILETPSYKEMPPEERQSALLESGLGYLAELATQVGRTEKLRELERRLREAREKKDRELEKRLLLEFSNLSRDSHQGLS